MDGCAPGIFGIGRMAPSTMLPDHRELFEVKGRSLRIGNVRLAAFVDENTAAGSHTSWPPQVQCPTNHVEHMDTHVSHNSIPVFHEGTPAAGMDQRIVWAHWSWPRPHFVIEMLRRHRIRWIFASSHMVVAIDFHQTNLA